jgi:hypothetical protein
LLRQKRSKQSFPLPNRLISEHPSSLEEHFGEISQTQLVTEPPQDNEEDDISGVFQEGERCSGALIEEALAS